jgi:hypothetical protein
MDGKFTPNKSLVSQDTRERRKPKRIFYLVCLVGSQYPK